VLVPKKIAKLVLSQLTEKRLREELSKYGLNATGTRDILELKYREFQQRYNANLDLSRPKKIEGVIKETENYVKCVMRTGGSRAPEPDLDLNEWKEKQEGQYRSLIMEIKNRRRMSRSKQNSKKVNEGMNGNDDGQDPVDNKVSY